MTYSHGYPYHSIPIVDHTLWLLVIEHSYRKRPSYIYLSFIMYDDLPSKHGDFPWLFIQYPLVIKHGVLENPPLMGDFPS